MKEEKQGFWKDFKAFIARGNVADMAVGIVVGTAFTAIVNSLVQEVIMPFVGWLIGGVNFSDLRIVLAPASGEIPEVAIRYGSFLNQIINFLIISFTVFVMIRLLGKFRRKKEEEAPAPERLCPYCCQPIAQQATRCPHCTSVLEGESVVAQDN